MKLLSVEETVRSSSAVAQLLGLSSTNADVNFFCESSEKREKEQELHDYRRQRNATNAVISEHVVNATGNSAERAIGSSHLIKLSSCRR